VILSEVDGYVVIKSFLSGDIGTLRRRKKGKEIKTIFMYNILLKTKNEIKIILMHNNTLFFVDLRLAFGQDVRIKGNTRPARLRGLSVVLDDATFNSIVDPDGFDKVCGNDMCMCL
jgi:hypothetical protein